MPGVHPDPVVEPSWLEWLEDVAWGVGLGVALAAVFAVALVVLVAVGR